MAGLQVPASPAVTYLGPLTASYGYTGTRFVLEPPGAQTPTVTWQTVEQAAAIRRPLAQGMSRTIELARVTDPSSGPARPDGSIEPFLNRTLAYVITTTGAPIRASRPPTRPGPVDLRHPTRTRPGRTVDIVSATTGHPLYGFAGPTLNRTPRT